MGAGNDLELDATRQLVGLDLVVPRSSWITAAIPTWPAGAIECDLIVDETAIHAAERGELEIDMVVKTNTSRSELLIDFGFDGQMDTVVRMSSACLALVNDGSLVAFLARLDSD